MHLQQTFHETNRFSIMIKYLNSNIGRLRVIAFLEGVSFIILVFLAMPLKYFADDPSLVRIMGGIHGFLFVILMVLLLIVWLEKKLTFLNSVWVFVSSLIPFGTFYIDYKILKPAHQ